MNAIQLEFKFDNEEMQEPEIGSLLHAHVRIDDANKSSEKVRKSLFMKVGMLEKMMKSLQTEVYEMKEILRDLKNEPSPWKYKQDECLFTLPD
jgi:chaperonin cofactor prefoldin